MKLKLKRIVALAVATMMVCAVVPFTAQSADWIPSDYKNYVFDAEFYAAEYPEVAKKYGNTEEALYAHFQEYGVNEGKRGSPTFCAKHYCYYNADISAQFGTDYKAALLHYIGIKDTSATYKPSAHTFFAGSFDAIISRASDTANGAFNVAACESATNASTGKYNVQASAANADDTKQIWTFAFNSSDGSYTIKNKYTGTVLDVNGGSKANSTNVSTYNSNSSNAQKWWIFERLPGQYVLAPVHCSGFSVLDIGGSTSEGTNAKIYQYNHTAAQLFNIQIVIPSDIKQTVFDYQYYAAKYPDIASKYGSTEAELFDHFTKFGLRDGLQGSPVFSASFYLNNNDGLVEKVGNHNVAGMMHYYNTGRDAKLYRTAPSEYFADIFEATINFTHGDINVGIASTATNEANNAWNVQTVAASESDNSQIWQFRYNAADGSYTITNKAHPNAALDVSGAAVANKTNIATYTNTGADDDHRRWYIFERTPGIYVISPKHSAGRALEVGGGYSSAGKNINLYTYNASSAQQLTISYYFTPAQKAVIYDADFYRNEYYETYVYGVEDDDLYKHFVSKGINAGLQGSPVFSPAYYLNNNPQVAQECGDCIYDAIMHYFNTGYKTSGLLTAPSEFFGDRFDAVIQLTYAQLTVGAAAASDGASVVTSTEKTNDPLQTWTFTYNEDDGSYTIINKQTSMALSSENGGYDIKTPIIIKTADLSDPQRWYLYERVPGEYVLSPKCAPARPMEVAGGYSSAGKPLKLYTYNATASQVFDISINGVYALSACDVNRDGNINVKDIINVLKYIKSPTPLYIARADVNLDGVIDYEDVELIQATLDDDYYIWYKDLKADDSMTSPTNPSTAKRHTLYTYDDITMETYTAVFAGFINKGFDIYSNSIKGDLYTTTFTNGVDFIHIYWLSTGRVLRIVEALGDADALPPANPVISNTDTPTTITQLSSTYLNGMGYIIQLCDGSFIIVDGGYADEHTRLYNKLVELNGGANGILIRAWLISHPHGDHYNCFKSFATEYASKVTLEYFLYSPDTPQYRISGWDGLFAWGGIYDSVNAFSGAKVLAVHTGMEFRFADVKLEILISADDIFVDYIPNNQNETSIVCRVYTPTKKAMLLADAGNDCAHVLEKYYGQYLKSDMCQASHHGVEDFPLSTYELIRAPIMFYPCNHALYDAQERFYDVRMAIKNSDYIKEILFHEDGHHTRSLK